MVENIHVYTHPMTEEQAPFDVHVNVVRDDEEVYDESRKVMNPETEPGFTLPETVVGYELPYEITVSPSSIDRKGVFDTMEYSRDLSDEPEADRCISLRFRITKSFVNPETEFCSE